SARQRVTTYSRSCQNVPGSGAPTNVANAVRKISRAAARSPSCIGRMETDGLPCDGVPTITLLWSARVVFGDVGLRPQQQSYRTLGFRKPAFCFILPSRTRGLPLDNCLQRPVGHGQRRQLDSV